MGSEETEENLDIVKPIFNRTKATVFDGRYLLTSEFKVIKYLVHLEKGYYREIPKMLGLFNRLSCFGL